MERVTLTNMCMITDGRRVVVQERLGDWPGVCFPGGHVEPGESLTDAIIREVREETGLTIAAPTLCGIKDWRQPEWNPSEDRYIVLMYKATRFSGELRSSDEGRVWWADIDQLANLDLCDGMDDTIRMYQSDEISEIFICEDGGEWSPHFK